MSVLEVKLGLIDWGIGGLSVYKELQAQLPISCVYFSDSGYTPYGKTTKRNLIRRLHKISEFFRKQHIRHIIIACNAASTVLEELQYLNKDIQYYGMLLAGAQSIRIYNKKRNLVLGGKRTIESHYFQNHFKNTKILLEGLVAQPLSAIIEKGDQHTQSFQDALNKVIKNLKMKPDLVLLACTHYPAATMTFKKTFPSAQIVDPAFYLIKDLKKKLRPLINKKQLKIN